MAMFRMYASKESVDYPQNEYVDNEQRENMNMNMENKTNENMDDDNDNDNDNDNVEEKGDEKEEHNNDNNENDKDLGSSPPLNPVIPSTASEINRAKGLDSLRERYYKKQLPPSFQPNALADAFQSESQQAIQNDLAELEDKTLLGGIKQSVSMITQSNE